MQLIVTLMWGLRCTLTVFLGLLAYVFPPQKRAAPIALPNFQFFGAAAIYTACSLIWPARETMIKESIFDDVPNSNEIVLGVKRGINPTHSPIARTISVNDDRSEKGKPSWSA
jgi:hypothetical protein